MMSFIFPVHCHCDYLFSIRVYSYFESGNQYEIVDRNSETIVKSIDKKKKKKTCLYIFK